MPRSSWAGSHRTAAPNLGDRSLVARLVPARRRIRGIPPRSRPDGGGGTRRRHRWRGLFPPGRPGRPSAVGVRLLDLLPNSFCVDKDLTASGFILAAARTAGLPVAEAYGTERYWLELRPLEYACSLSTACANLIGTRIVFTIGGWGPELGVDRLWTGLQKRLFPARLTVVHLEAPDLETWRRRLAARGSRSDSPWFESFANAVTSVPVWDGAIGVPTDGPLHEVVASVLACLPQFDPLEPEPLGRPEAST